MYALRFNLAWCISSLVPVIAVTLIVSAAAFLLMRSLGLELDTAYFALCVVVTIEALLVLYLSRRLFIPRSESLSRMDFALGFNNRLSVAAQGIGTWPEPSEAVSDGLHWKGNRHLVLFAAAVVLFAASIFIPVQKHHEPSAKPAQAPLNVQELEKLVEELRREDIAEEEKLKEIERVLAEMTAKSPQEQYSHSNLEALDRLLEQTTKEIARQQNTLERAQSLAAKLAKRNSNDPETAQAQAELQQSLRELQISQMVPGQELRDALRQLQRQEGAVLTPEQARELREKLEEGAKRLGKMQSQQHARNQSGANGGLSGNAREESQNQSCQSNGTSGGMCSADSGEKGTRRGVSRGPGTAPLALNEKPPQLTSTQTESLQSGKLNTDEMGEVIGLESRRPDVPQRYEPGTAGGQSGTQSHGGHAVWDHEFTPNEKKIIERFFK